jgi:hypothetical protein
MSRFIVVPSGGQPLDPNPMDRWCVRPEDDAHNVAKHVPYAVAVALARHLNGQNPEAGDVAALVDFILARGRA